MMLRGILCGTVASLSSLSTYQATPRTLFTSVDLNLRFQSNQTSLDILQAALTDVKTGYNGGVACCAAFILNHPAIQGSCSMQDAILFSKDMRLTWGQMILSLETRWHSSSPLQLPGSGVLLSKIPLEKHLRAPIRVYHEMPGCLGLEFVLDLGAPRATSTTVSLTLDFGFSVSRCQGLEIKLAALPAVPVSCQISTPQHPPRRVMKHPHCAHCRPWDSIKLFKVRQPYRLQWVWLRQLLWFWTDTVCVCMCIH